MNNGGNIVWLASYPKSGNTWFRVFIENLFLESDTPIDINALSKSPIASSRSLFDEYAGVASSDMTLQEIENLRPYIYDEISNQSTYPSFLKIHDAFIFTAEEKPLVSKNAGRAAIYFIRNPLDVAVSFCHHLSASLEKTVDILNNPLYSFSQKGDRLHNQLCQKLLDWSGHVDSWLNQSIIPVKVVRYEDMIKSPFVTFKSVLDFLNLIYTDEEILQAITFSDIKELQKQEKEKGFREKAPESAVFFRKGKHGTWREELADDLVEKILVKHSAVMKKFGYLDEHDKPI